MPADGDAGPPARDPSPTSDNVSYVRNAQNAFLPYFQGLSHWHSPATWTSRVAVGVGLPPDAGPTQTPCQRTGSGVCAPIGNGCGGIGCW